MRRKLLSLILTCCMVMGMLAACGKGEEVKKEETSNEVTSIADSAAQTENVNETTGESSGEEEVTIKLALWDYDSEGSVYPALVEAFEKANPNIKVEVISAASGDYETKLSTMLGGGEDIDVFFGKSNTQYPTLVLKEFALQIDDLIASHNYDLTAYGGVLDEHYRLDGALYALPFRTNDWVIFYNKNIFDEAGVPYPTNDMTWEEYREIGKKITSGEGENKIYGIGFIPKMGFVNPALIGSVEGFDITTSDFSELKYALEYYLALQNEDQTYEPYAQSKSMNQDQTYFYKGTTGMLYNGSWFVQMLVGNKDKIDFEWGMVKQPYWEGTEQKLFITSTPVLIGKNTKHPEEAYKFLTFFTGEEGANVLAALNYVPSYMTDGIMETYRNSTGLDEDSMAAITGNKVYGLSKPNVLMGVISDMMNEELELAITGNQSVDKTLENMTIRREEIIEQNK